MPHRIAVRLRAVAGRITVLLGRLSVPPLAGSRLCGGSGRFSVVSLWRASAVSSGFREITPGRSRCRSLSRLLPRRGLVEHAPRGVGHRHVDHLAVDRGAGAALRQRLVERLQHAGVVVEFVLARRIEPVARLDLRRMDQLAPAKAEPARQRGVLLEARPDRARRRTRRRAASRTAPRAPRAACGSARASSRGRRSTRCSRDRC